MARPTDRELEEFFAGLQARLRTLRAYLCLTQEEMAHRLDMTVRTYKAWESRRHTRWTRVVLRLSDEFGVSTDWMIRGHYPGRPRDDTIPMMVGGAPLPRPMRH